jgi:hypothetical protein
MWVDMHRSEAAKSFRLEEPKKAQESASQVVVGVVVGCAPDHQTGEGTSGGEQNEGEVEVRVTGAQTQRGSWQRVG